MDSRAPLHTREAARIAFARDLLALCDRHAVTLSPDGTGSLLIAERLNPRQAQANAERIAALQWEASC